MIACFLRAESASPRWGDTFRALLLRDGKPHRIISAADLANAEETAYRRLVDHSVEMARELERAGDTRTATALS